MTCTCCGSDGAKIHELGARVRFLRNVERFPHFVVKAGETGVVANNCGGCYAVRLDRHEPGADGWGNEVLWNKADPLDLGDYHLDVGEEG